MKYKKESSTKRGYNYRWKKYRLIYLQENPLCVFCKEDGNISKADVVDHIVPHKGDTKLFWDKDNHQPLCKFHHDSTKQAIENGKEKPVIGLDGWAI